MTFGFNYDFFAYFGKMAEIMVFIYKMCMVKNELIVS